VYAATHPAAFIKKEKAPQLPAAETLWPADLSAAFDRDADDDPENE